MTTAPRAAECLVCPHPAASHDETGCRPATGMCACTVPASKLPPTPDPVEALEPDPVVMVCMACGAPWQPVQRGQCLRCGSDGGSVPEDQYVPPAPVIEVPTEPAPALDVPTDAATNLAPELPEEPASTEGADADAAGQQESAPSPSDDDDEDDGYDGPLRADGQPPGTRRNYDWPGMKRRYVEGIKGQREEITEWPSLEAVAQHFKVPGSRVRERAAQEGWREQRVQWQAYVERTRQQARAAGLARIGQDLDNRAVDATKIGLQLCITVLTERANAAQAARSGGGAAGDVLNALELTRLAQAVDLWHRIGLRAVGDPEVTRLEITGANGRPVEISQELRRDDPDRMATVLAVLAQAGMGDIFGAPAADGSGTLALQRGADGTYAPVEP